MPVTGSVAVAAGLVIVGPVSSLLGLRSTTVIEYAGNA